MINMSRSNSNQTIMVESAQWMAMLMEGAAQLNITMSIDQATLLARHARLLLAWNRKINLTAITDPVQMAVKHFLDSVAPLAHIPIEGELLDMGTGGGFPGIPLKIMRPGQPMVLIDATRKKVNFVKQVIRELKLDYIEALHTRAEAMGMQEQHAGRYTVIVSRAVADLKVVAQLAEPLLAAGGMIVVFKGPRETLPDTLRLESSEGQGTDISFQVTSTAYHLPIIGDQRRVVLLKAPPL